MALCRPARYPWLQTAASWIAVVVVALLSATAAPARAGTLAPLSTRGNQIVRLGVPFSFHGVNRDTLEWGNANWGGCGGDGHFTATDFARIAAWHATAVRIPLSEADWLGRRCAGVDYPALVDAVVSAANAQGLYVILDLHWSDANGWAPCDQGCASGQQPMPDADSVRFWTQLAARYANAPGVIFDLYNEPHDVSWACWRSGGCSVTSSTPAAGSSASVSYTAVGMQTLLDAVRRTGATNLVLAAGLDWAYDLSGVVHGYGLSGANVAYDSHIYTRWHSTTADWDSHVGIVAQSQPVTVTELGATDCSTSVTAPLLHYLSAPMGVAADRISWSVWSWNSPGSCSQPSLIADWNGTPLAGQGSLVHSTLAALWSTSAAVTIRTPSAPRRAGSTVFVRRVRIASHVPAGAIARGAAAAIAAAAARF
jgi:aryl-phospho-beta-D-glucosidase BglC (GH1 family)